MGLSKTMFGRITGSKTGQSGTCVCVLSVSARESRVRVSGKEGHCLLAVCVFGAGVCVRACAHNCVGVLACVCRCMASASLGQAKACFEQSFCDGSYIVRGFL